jgi:hypothetical protein
MAEESPLTIDDSAPTTPDYYPADPNWANQPDNRVDLDMDNLIGQGFSRKDAQDTDHVTDEIAREALRRYSYQDAGGDFQQVDDRMYDYLKGYEGWTPEEIMTTFANVRDIGEVRQGLEGVRRGVFSGSGGMAGATAGGFTLGPLGAVGGFFAGAILGDIANSQMFPDSQMPAVNPSASRIYGEVLGGGFSGMTAPLATRGVTQFNLGSRALERYANRLPFASGPLNTMSSGVNKLENSFMGRMEAAREFPAAFLLMEGREVNRGALAAAGAEAYLGRGDRGAGNAALDFGAEVIATTMDGPGKLARWTANHIVPGMRAIRENLSSERRAMNAGQRFWDILDAHGNDRDFVVNILRANPDTEVGRAYLDKLGPEGREYLSLLDEAGISQRDRTSGIQSGIPILYAFESAGYPNIRRAQGLSPEAEFDPVIGQKHVNSLNHFDLLMETLLDTGDSDALDLFSQMRTAKYQEALTRKIEQFKADYDGAVQVAFETGETFDSSLAFNKIFFGADGSGGIIRDINQQSGDLLRGVPQDVVIDPAAFNFKNADGVPEGLLAAYNNIIRTRSIRGMAPRISSGKDLHNLDSVLKRFDAYINPDNYTKDTGNFIDPVDAPELMDTAITRESFDQTQEASNRAGARTMPEGLGDTDAHVTSQELVTFLRDISQARAAATSGPNGGNTALLEILSEIENGALQTLEQTARGEGLSNRLRARFQNYTDFKRQSNSLFSSAFLGKELPNAPPELTYDAVFNKAANSNLMHMIELDKAANFLSVRNDMNLPDQAPFSSVPIRDIQNRMVRGLLSEKYFKVVDDTDQSGLVQSAVDMGSEGLEGTSPAFTLKPTPAFTAYMADPTNQEMLQTYFPALWADLQDVNNTRTAYRNLLNSESTDMVEAAQAEELAKVFRGMDNPQAAIIDMLGDPSSRRRNGAAEKRFINMAQQVSEDGGQKAKDGFLNAVLHAGYSYANGEQAISDTTGATATSVGKLIQYFDKPIYAGGKKTVIDVLTQTGILTDQAHAMKFRRLLAEMDKVQATMSPARAEELGDIPGPEGMQDAQAKIANALLGVGGAGLMSGFYGFLQRNIPFIGSTGGLMSSALGADLSRSLLKDKPQLVVKNLFTSLINDPERLGHVLELSRNYVPGQPLPKGQLDSLYTWFYGAGLLPLATTFEEFVSAINPPKDRGVAAPPERSVLGTGGRRNPRRVAPSGGAFVLPQELAPQAVVPPPQASVAPPTPRPAAQAQPQRQAPQQPAPQGIASLPQGQPSVDQSMQQLFPFDTLSQVRGIGSLG